MEFDYNLADDGIHITDDYFSIIFDGTCHEAGIPYDSIVRSYSSMPYFDPNGHSLQIMLSEYSIGSVLKTIIDSKFVSYNFTTNSDQITAVISDFEQPFGD
jgi:hypothetical protein